MEASDGTGRDQQHAETHTHSFFLPETPQRAKLKGVSTVYFLSLSLSLTCYFRRRKEARESLEQTGRSRRRGGKSSCSDEGRRNDMRSTDGEKGGTPREEGRGAITRAAAGIQWLVAEQPGEVDCTRRSPPVTTTHHSCGVLRLLHLLRRSD